MEEQTFLNEGNVTVTNTRFIVPGETFAMAGVTSVSSLKDSPSRWGPIILIVIGAFGLSGSDTIPGGLMSLAAGIAWWVLKKPKYIVLLTTASGEAQAFPSKDEAFIARIVNALSEAIVARG